MSKDGKVLVVKDIPKEDFVWFKSYAARKESTMSRVLKKLLRQWREKDTAATRASK